MLEKLKKIIYVLLAALILLVACSKNEEQAGNNEEKKNDLEEKAPPEKDATPPDGENVFPLTGMKTDEAVNNRIVGVMVNNHTKARPQTGLPKADIVFEILAEGRITRFLALFQSQTPEVVGPVRSAREYYFELANGYNALYVYHGAANFVNDMIKDRGIEHLNGSMHDNDGILFKRESFRKAPHNSYLQFGAVYDAAESKQYETTASYTPLPFLKEEADISGEAAQHITVDYTKGSIGTVVEFDYDKNSEKYTRFSDKVKTVELDSEEPIQVENVFIIETDHKVIDDAGRREVDITSGGNAYLIQKGKVRELKWENQDGRIIPVKDGKPVGFVPGKTWINVIPTNPGLKQSVTISN